MVKMIVNNLRSVKRLTKSTLLNKLGVLLRFSIFIIIRLKSLLLRLHSFDIC